MARIRTIKPEFWTSEQVVECSPSARLLFIGLWNFCDDYGIHPASLKSLKMQVFPGDDDATTDQIARWVDELLKNDLLIEYVVENKRYWKVTGWKHQKIEKRTSRFPGPEKGQKFDDRSTTVRRPFDPGREGKGREGKGKEASFGRRCRGNGAGAPSDPRKALWDLAVQLLGERNRSLIGKAVKQHGEEQVAKILAGMALKLPADPVAYFQAALNPRTESEYDRR